MDFQYIFLKHKSWRIKGILIFILSVLTSVLYSQNHTISFNKKSNGIQVIQNDNNQMVMMINFDGIDAIEVNSSKGAFRQLDLPGCYRIGEPGNPQLPSLRKLIEIPYGAKCRIEVIDFEIQEFNLSDVGIHDKVMPFQPSYSKSIDPSKIEFQINNEAYTKDEFNKLDLASIESVGRLRGIELAKITINPVRYNPVKNSVLIYNNIQVKVTYEDGNQTLTKNINAKTNSPYFDALYSTILNHSRGSKDSYTDNPDHTKFPVKYLIITAPEFESELASFVEWKTRKGFYVNMVTTSEIGSTPSEIKTWVQQQYDAGTETDPAPTFLLIVGDVAQVPASATGASTGKATDLYYCTMDGTSDIIPDIYYGRLSAQNATQLQNQLSKILYYEKYEFSNPTYLNKTTLIAGADGTMNPKVLQPTINYGTTNYFNIEHGFTTVNTYLNSYSGCYDADKIKVSFINYTAHCSETSWGDPNLTQTMVNNFANANQYPLAIGNCCLAADFGISECIGETWMRKANGGSVAYIGSSPSSYWYEDFYWAVGAHIPVANQFPTFEGSTLGAYDAPFVSDYTCVDALVFVGDLAVNEAIGLNYEHEVSARYYWEAYNCLSDPSIFIYYTEGNNNPISHATGFPIGNSTFDVTASPNSLVAISKDGVLLGTAFVPESGNVNVNVTPINTTGNVDIVITKSQYKPYIASIPAEVQSGPYLSLVSFVIADSSGNGSVEINEPFNIILTIKNVGSETAQSITATVSTTDNAITKSSDNLNISLGNLNASDEMSVENHFAFTTSDSVVDQATVNFNVVLTDNSAGKKTYNFNRYININAPKFMLGDDLFISDIDANNNGILDPGENGTLKIAITNTGHASTNVAAKLLLSTPSAYLVLNTEIDSLGLIEANQTKWFEFNVTAAGDTPEGTVVSLIADSYSYDSLYVDENSYSLIIGQIPELQIGTGTTLAVDYPFNNHYENNKTQILFLASEIGTGNKVIKDIAFDLGYYTHDATDRDLHNLKVRMMGTNKSSLNQFEDLSSCQPVFDTIVFNINTSLGWQAINFQHYYAHIGSDNIIVEITWGDNGEYAMYSDRTKVKCTSTSNISVAYGFADSQTPPELSGTSVIRPNVLMHFGNSYNLTFVVLNENNQPVSDASVVIDNQEIKTNASGLSKFVFAELQSDIAFTINAYGYENYVGTVDLNSTNVFDTVHLTLVPRHDLTFNVLISGSAIQGANIQVGDVNIETDVNGVAQFNSIIEGYNYEYVVNYDGFIAQSENISIYSDTTITINLIENIKNPIITSITNLKNGNAKILWSGFKAAENQESNTKHFFGYTLFLDGQQMANGITTNDYTFSGLTTGQSYVAGIQGNYLTGNSNLVTSEFTYSQIFTIDFKISANESGLQGATIEFDGIEKNTDVNGSASFDISSEGLKNYKVIKSGYYDLSGTINVLKDTSIMLEMKTIPDVKFEIHTIDNVALNDALIELKGLEGITDMNGIYTFEDIASADGLIFTVKKSGYLDVLDTLNLQDSDTTIDITLFELADVTFIVKDIYNQPVSDVEIEFNNLEIFTDSLGIALFNDVLPGANQAYKVSKSTFIDRLSSVDIELENKIIVVNLKYKPSIEFVVSGSGKKLIGSEVIFNGITMYTDADGIVKFPFISAGTYSYSVNYPGYYCFNDSIKVDESDMVSNVNLQFIPDITFTIESEGQPVEKAKVTLGPNVKYTNVSGQAMFCNIFSGKYPYTVDLDGYYTTHDSIEIANKDLEKVINFKSIPDVKLTITDGSNIVEGAKVELNGIIKFTNAEGQVIFTDLPANNYNCIITKDLFVDFNETIVVGEFDIDETIIMNLKKYQVNFMVMDKLNPVSGAIITIQNQVLVSNEMGEAEFPGILPANNIQYSVTKEGYFSKDGIINVENGDVNISVGLTLITYNVEFEVSDIYGKLPGAEVEFNGERKYTLSEGLVEFSQIIPSSELTYKISKTSTHNLTEGSINLISDTLIRVSLTTIDINEKHLPEYSIFPNPSKNTFTVTIPGTLTGFDYEIFDQTGRKILSGCSQMASVKVDVKLLSKGVYFIKLTIEDKKITEKIIIE